jgi:hypothetical protein
MAEAAPALEAAVRAHRVCWELDVRTSGAAGQEHALIELTLLGRCARGDPAQAECHAVHQRLVALTERVIPRSVVHHVEPFDASVHLRPESGFAPEVEVLAELVCPASEAAAVRRALEDALEGLGAQSRTWSDEIRHQAGRVRRAGSQLNLLG